MKMQEIIAILEKDPITEENKKQILQSFITTESLLQLIDSFKDNISLFNAFLQNQDITNSFLENIFDRLDEFDLLEIYQLCKALALAAQKKNFRWANLILYRLIERNYLEQENEDFLESIRKLPERLTCKENIELLQAAANPKFNPENLNGRERALVLLSESYLMRGNINNAARCLKQIAENVNTDNYAAIDPVLLAAYAYALALGMPSVISLEFLKLTKEALEPLNMLDDSILRDPLIKQDFDKAEKIFSFLKDHTHPEVQCYYAQYLEIKLQKSAAKNFSASNTNEEKNLIQEILSIYSPLAIKEYSTAQALLIKFLDSNSNIPGIRKTFQTYSETVARFLDAAQTRMNLLAISLQLKLKYTDYKYQYNEDEKEFYKAMLNSMKELHHPIALEYSTFGKSDCFLSENFKNHIKTLLEALQYSIYIPGLLHHFITKLNLHDEERGEANEVLNFSIVQECAFIATAYNDPSAFNMLNNVIFAQTEGNFSTKDLDTLKFIIKNSFKLYFSGIGMFEENGKSMIDALSQTAPQIVTPIIGKLLNSSKENFQPLFLYNTEAQTLPTKVESHVFKSSNITYHFNVKLISGKQGNCFFNAVKHPREQVVTAMQTMCGNPHYLNFMAQEIFSELIHDLSMNKDTTLRYLNIKKDDQAKLIALLKNYLNKATPDNRESCLSFLAKADFYRNYINSTYQRDRWMSYDIYHKTAIDIVADIFNLEIYIYHKDLQGSLSELYKAIPLKPSATSAKKIHLLHTGYGQNKTLCHFNLLEVTAKIEENLSHPAATVSTKQEIPTPPSQFFPKSIALEQEITNAKIEEEDEELISALNFSLQLNGVPQ